MNGKDLSWIRKQAEAREGRWSEARAGAEKGQEQETGQRQDRKYIFGMQI